MLLGYFVLICAVAFAANKFPSVVRGYIDYFLAAMGPGSIWVLPAAAVIALALFIASCWRKNPQVQFLLELAATLCLMVFIPTY